MNAPAPLSGLNPEINGQIKLAAIEALHGPKMAALESSEETVSTCEAAIQVASDEMSRMVEAI